MKNHFKKLNLIGLSFLGTFLMICLINITNGVTNIPTAPGEGESEHTIRLHSLFLWNNPSDDKPLYVKINTGEKFLSVEGGLAIGKNNIVDPNVDSSVIGGGKNNQLTNGSKNSGIVGGEGNKIINGKNSLIGGGKSNTIQADNAIIGGGNNNTVSAINSVVVGGENNEANGKNSIVLGGQNNKTNGENSLVFGQYSEGNTGSFVFGIGKQNQHVIGKENSARIDASSGVLIGTLTPITGVKLVINGAVSLTGVSNTDGGTGGEIRVVNGCIYAFDGKYWQVMGKSSRESCGGPIKKCQFGETILYQGDQVDAYTNFRSLQTECSDTKVHVTCSGGNLVDDHGSTGPFFPYCYKIGNN